MTQPKHRFSAQVIERDASARATAWRGTCGRHANWFGSTYEEIEDAWRRHVYDETGRVVDPQGDKVNRWTPEAVAQ